VDDVCTRLAGFIWPPCCAWLMDLGKLFNSFITFVIIRDAPIYYNEFYLWKRLPIGPWLMLAWLTVALVFLNPLRGGLVSRFGILHSLNFDEKLCNLASSGTYLMFSIIIIYSKNREEYYKDSNGENSYAIYSKDP
jgi:hypothetical protein